MAREQLTATLDAATVDADNAADAVITEHGDAVAESAQQEREPKQNQSGDLQTSDLKGKQKRKRTKCSAMAELKKELRSDSFHAASPKLFVGQCSDNDNGSDSDSDNRNNLAVRSESKSTFICTRSDDHNEKDKSFPEHNAHSHHTNIAFDVYNPNANFRKTMPGMPDFCVVVSPFGEPSAAPFSMLKAIVKVCEGGGEGDGGSIGVPLKIATVSDLGTVAMFGITDFGVPPIR